MKPCGREGARLEVNKPSRLQELPVQGCRQARKVQRASRRATTCTTLRSGDILATTSISSVDG
jgi:hypothetical protein